MWFKSPLLRDPTNFKMVWVSTCDNGCERARTDTAGTIMSHNLNDIYVT
jgi:hypothetical protein